MNRRIQLPTLAVRIRLEKRQRRRGGPRELGLLSRVRGVYRVDRRTFMTHPRWSLGALAVASLLAVLVSTDRVSNGQITSDKISVVQNGPSISQLNDPKFQMKVMDQRVTDLETKLAAVQKQLAAALQQNATHTHSYHAPQCVEFVSLLNLQAAINNPGAHAGMGVCMLRPLVGGMPAAQTSAPGK
jgi:hypothetical protein